MADRVTLCMALLFVQLGFILQGCLPLVHGHGLLYNPPGRNFQAYNTRERNYLAYSNNGGGSLKVSQNNKLDWPKGVHSLCGDPDGENRWMTPRAIQAVYKEGQVIETQVLIWNHHGGRYGFNVCPKDAKKQDDCTPLERADGQSQWWYPPLPQNDPTLSKLWSVYGPNLQPGTDTNGNFEVNRAPGRSDGMDQFKDTPVYVTQWRLPYGFTCTDGCILQWYWLTGNSCWPACDKADPMYPNCRKRCTRPNCICGEDAGTAYPEEFWNCVDVKILPAQVRNNGGKLPGGKQPSKKSPPRKKSPPKKTPKKSPKKPSQKTTG